MAVNIVWGEDEYKQFENLCEIQCTIDEVCHVMNVTDKTLNRLLKEHYKSPFSAVYKRFADNGRRSLRRKQYQLAMSGNATMLIWLGKQYLGQADKQELTGNEGGAIKITSLTDAIADIYGSKNANSG